MKDLEAEARAINGNHSPSYMVCSFFWQGGTVLWYQWHGHLYKHYRFRPGVLAPAASPARPH
jgi:hypothetical protein